MHSLQTLSNLLLTIGGNPVCFFRNEVRSIILIKKIVLKEVNNFKICTKYKCFYQFYFAGFFIHTSTYFLLDLNIRRNYIKLY